MPPIHCITHRHMIMLLETVSDDVSKVAPVVVNPLIVSKKASVNESNTPLNRKGNMPNSEKTTHTEAVSTIASLRPISLEPGRINVINNPLTPVITMLITNDIVSVHESIIEVANGIDMKAVSISKSQPMTRANIGMLINE